MGKPKQYKLHTSDLLAIPEDRFDDFLIDLKKWHKIMRQTLGMLNNIAKFTGETEVPPDVGYMVWIDDGKHDGKVIIKQTKGKV